MLRLEVTGKGDFWSFFDEVMGKIVFMCTVMCTEISLLDLLIDLQ